MRVTLFPSVVLSLAVASPAAGQISTVTTETDYGVHASAWSSLRPPFYFPRQSTPAGTVIAAPLQHYAQVSGASSSAAQLDGTITPRPLGLDIAINGFAASGLGGQADARLDPVPCSLLWELTGQQSGWITLGYDGAGFLDNGNFSSTAGVDLDVGADGTVEFSVQDNEPQHVAIPVRLNGTTRIRVTVRYSVGMNFASFLPGYSDMACTLRFTTTRPAIPITSYGERCGADLSATDAASAVAHRIDFAVTNGTPNGLAAFVFGTKRRSLPLHGLPCRVLLEPVNAALIPTDPFGNARLAFVLPAPIPPLPEPVLRVQAVTFDPVRIDASQGIELHLAGR